MRVTFSRPQSRSFALLVRSQVATGPLPFEHSVGLVTVDKCKILHSDTTRRLEWIRAAMRTVFDEAAPGPITVLSLAVAIESGPVSAFAKRQFCMVFQRLGAPGRT